MSGDTSTAITRAHAGAFGRRNLLEVRPLRRVSFDHWRITVGDVVLVVVMAMIVVAFVAWVVRFASAGKRVDLGEEFSLSPAAIAPVGDPAAPTDEGRRPRRDCFRREPWVSGDGPAAATRLAAVR
jgi:hypothetical protein